MWQYIFILWLGFLPIITQNNTFEGPKIQVFWIGNIFLFIFWIFRFISKKEISFTKSDYVYFLWLVVLTISSLLGVHPLESIIGGSYRHQGVIFFLSLWVIGKTITILGKENKIFLYRLILFTGTIESIVLVSQRLVSSNEVLGTFGNKSAAAGFVALSLLLPKVNLSGIKKHIFYLISGLGIFASGSITSLFIAVAYFLKRKYLVVVILFLAVGTLVLRTNMNFNDPYEGRGIIWKLAITSIKERPILGYGAESGEVVFNEAFRVYGTRLEGLIVDRAHNIFLDVSMWSGLLGLILFIYWIYLRLKESKQMWVFTAFIGWLIFASVQPLGVVHWIIFIVYLY